MKLRVRVDAEQYIGPVVTACADVPDAFVRAFDPVRTCCDPDIRNATGELSPSDIAVTRIVKLREEAAAEIAKALTAVLMAAMEANDTIDGYPVRKLPDDLRRQR